MLGLGAVIAATVVAGCRSEQPDTRDGAIADIDPDREGGPTFDMRIEATVRTPSCAVASTICVGSDVHACVAGQAGDLVETCPEACSLGRCTSAACSAAEQGDALRGCRFYAVQVDNVDSDDGADMMLILTNASPMPASAVLASRMPVGGWTPLATEVVPPRGSVRMVRHGPVGVPGVTPAGAFRIDTDVPVSIVEVVSDDVDHGSHSSGGTVLLPAHALDAHYLAVTAPQDTSAQIAAAAGSRGGAGMIVVVGTVDRTTVTLKPTAPALVSAPATIVMPGLAPYTMMLDEGDVLQLFSASPGGDLSGSQIDADYPVSVLSGNVSTSYGYDSSGVNGFDLALEQMPPKYAVGSEYIGARLDPQAECDSYFGSGVGSWQVLAVEDGTQISFYPQDGVVFEPALPSPLVLGAGKSARFKTRGDFLARSSQPFLLAQWLDCEPGLSLGIDTRFGGGTMVIAFPPSFDHELVLVRRVGTSVRMDDAPVEDRRFTSLGAGSNYEVARLSGEKDLGSCGDLTDGCRHVIQGDSVGISWRGMDIVCSYSLTVPSADACLVPNVPCIN